MDDFNAQLMAWLQAHRDDMKARYNRVLPVGELLFNRFDKAEYLHMGEGSSVYDSSVVMGDIQVGAHVWIGPHTVLEGINGTITIGDFVSINSGVMIFTHDSTQYYLSGGKNPVVKGDVTIGSNTVVGSMSMVGYGVSIGHHCVVGAGSLVSKDVPDYAIVAGTPAAVIGRVVLHDDGTVVFEYTT